MARNESAVVATKKMQPAAQRKTLPSAAVKPIQASYPSVGIRSGAPTAKNAARSTAKPKRTRMDEKKAVEVEQRLTVLTNEKLRERSEELLREVASLRESEKALEAEREKLQQWWMLARSDAEWEEQEKHETEMRMHRMHSHHANTISQLEMKMRTLILTARTTRVAATQTDSLVEAGPLTSTESQTEAELKRETAAVLLRQNDRLLSEFVEEMEREKLNARSQLKYSIVQLEQRMRQENDAAMRKLREEKAKQLEELSALHSEQMIAAEEVSALKQDSLQTRIAQMEEEVAELEDQRDSLKIDVEVERGKAERAHTEASETRRRAEVDEQKLAALLTERQTLQRNASETAKMRREAFKYKELNEILLSEFSKLQEERDQLIDIIQKNISRIEGLNLRRHSNLLQLLAQVQQRKT